MFLLERLSNETLSLSYRGARLERKRIDSLLISSKNNQFYNGARANFYLNFSLVEHLFTRVSGQNNDGKERWHKIKNMRKKDWNN